MTFEFVCSTVSRLKKTRQRRKSKRASRVSKREKNSKKRQVEWCQVYHFLVSFSANCNNCATQSLFCACFSRHNGSSSCGNRAFTWPLFDPVCQWILCVDVFKTRAQPSFCCELSLLFLSREKQRAKYRRVSEAIKREKVCNHKRQVNGNFACINHNSWKLTHTRCCFRPVKREIADCLQRN